LVLALGEMKGSNEFSVFQFDISQFSEFLLNFIQFTTEKIFWFPLKLRHYSNYSQFFKLILQISIKSHHFPSQSFNFLPSILQLSPQPLQPLHLSDRSSPPSSLKSFPTCLVSLHHHSTEAKTPKKQRKEI
jgi:hypothetical protein